MRQEQVQQAGQGMEQRQKTPLRKRRIMAIIIVALLVTVAIVVAQVLSNTMIIPAIWGNIASAIVGAFGAVFAFFALIPLLFPSDERQPKPALSAAKASTSQAATMPQLPANEVSTPTITQASTSDKEEGRSDQYTVTIDCRSAKSSAYSFEKAICEEG
jgi:flagellar basal body-associated protein FliL